MRALRYAAVGGPLEVVDLPVPDCPPDGVVVRVEATGVCRSDWHAWRGHDPVELPHVGGHEFAGTVAGVGSLVEGVEVGQRVTAPFVQGCGRCEWCVGGHAQVCPAQTQPGFTHDGSFAEYVVVRRAATNLVQLPDGLDAVAAAALGCRFATAYHGLMAQARLLGGETVAVHGCGGVGLSAVMVAVAAGAEVVAVDPSPGARRRALDLGAQVAVADSGGITDMHVSVDAYGSAVTAQASVRCLRRRGRHLQLGLMLGSDAMAGLPWDLLVARELQVVGGHGMPAVEYPAMLRLVAGLRLEALVERVITLEEVAIALPAMDDPSAAAGIVVARP